MRAAERLRADATWDQKPSLPDEDDLPAFLTGAPPTPRSSRTGRRRLMTAHRSSSATYHRPFIAHGSIAPSCAVALAARRRAADLVPQPGRVQPAPGDRARIGNAAGAVGGPPRRGRRVLRPQRRRRRRDGRGAARAGRAGQAGAGGVVARRRAGVGAAGNRRCGPDLGRDRERRHRVVVAARDLERHLHQPSRHDTAARHSSAPATAIAPRSTPTPNRRWNAGAARGAMPFPDTTFRPMRWSTT